MTASIWDQILSRIETKVNRHSFYTWFKPTTFVADGGGSITIRVPNPLFTNWLKQVMVGGTRVLMIIDAPDDLEQLMSPPGLKDACKYAESLYRKTKTVRVRIEAGTDLINECGEYPVMTQWGFDDERGHVDHSGVGHIHTYPN